MMGEPWVSAPATVGFAAIPSWMIRDTSRISKHAMLAYLALASRVNEAGEAWPSIALIAAEARCSRTSAKVALAELEALGIITKRQTKRDDGGYGHNIYQVHIGMRAGQHAARPSVAVRPTLGQPATDTRSTGDHEVDPVEVEEVEVEGYALGERGTWPSSKSLDRTPSGIYRFERDDVSDDLPATTAQIEYLLHMYETCGIRCDGDRTDFAAQTRAEISARISDMQGMYRSQLRSDAA